MSHKEHPAVSLDDLTPVEGHFYLDSRYVNRAILSAPVFSAKAIEDMKENGGYLLGRESGEEEEKLNLSLIDLGDDLPSFPAHKGTFYRALSEIERSPYADYRVYNAHWAENDRKLIEANASVAVKRDDLCPHCGDEMHREDVDVGVGIIYGPYGCNCGYSEDPDYNMLNGNNAGVQEDGSYIDQYGVIYPKGNIIAKAMAYGEAQETKEEPLT